MDVLLDAIVNLLGQHARLSNSHNGLAVACKIGACKHAEKGRRTGTWDCFGVGHGEINTLTRS